MGFLRLGALTAIATAVSLGANAADLAYPPSVVIPPQYGGAPPPAPLAPQVVAPGAPLPPRAACDPIWSCGYRGCGWLPGCTPYPEFYPNGYGSPVPEAYPDLEAQQEPEPYYRRYGSPGLELYPQLGPLDPESYYRRYGSPGPFFYPDQRPY
jgi:hypothetical protein